MRVLLVSANRERKPSPVMPLGVLWVAAAVRRAQHEVRVLDLCFVLDPHAALSETIRAFPPDVVGIGLRNLCGNTYADDDTLVDYYQALARSIRAATSAPLVLGGSAFSLRPRQLLERLGADHGVVGEGEQTFLDLLTVLAAGDHPPLLSYAPAVAQHLPPSARRSGLDGLPFPARDLVDPRYFTDGDGTINVQTKRGCAFACAYCDYPDLEGRMLRLRDPEVVADEAIACASIVGATHLFLVDSVFNNPRHHALAVCRAIERRGGGLPWICYASPAVVDRELCEAMARAGCVGVELGSDSGTDETLARLHKPFRRDDIVSAHRYFAEAGIRDCHTFVVGAFNETPAEVAQTIEFVDELDPDVAVFIVFREDRETRGVGGARDRTAILELLAREAPRRPGWVVPELDIRFGDRVEALLARQSVRGPSWLHLASLRRRTTRARGRVGKVCGANT